MPKSNLSIYSRRLFEARLSVGWSQEKLGALLGLDEGVASVRIIRYESGTHQPPLKTAQKIAKILGHPLAYFFCEDDELATIIKNFKKNRVAHSLSETHTLALQWDPNWDAFKLKAPHLYQLKY